MFLNYPNNPTGGVIEDDFFARAVEFARRNDVIVVHDNAYSEITYDGYRAPSFLETPGAMDVGIEIFSLSKTYNMTGWRAGAVVGNPDLVARLLAAQDEHRQRHVRGPPGGRRGRPALRPVLRRRDVRDLPAPPRRARGRAAPHRPEVDPPKGAIYVWARVPEGDTSASFTERCSRTPRWSSRRRGLRPERRGLRADEPHRAGRAPQRGGRPDRRARRPERRRDAAGSAGPAASADAVVPARAHPGDAGLDLSAVEPLELPPGGRAAVPDRASPSPSRRATPASSCRARAWRAATASRWPTPRG